MPEDNDTKGGMDEKKDSKLDSAAVLPHVGLESTPVPSIEQEPQTSAIINPSNRPSGPLPNQSQDTSNGAPFATPPQVANSPQKSKKKWLIGGVIAGIIALLAAGGAMAYFSYQNPDKVVADGFVNLFNNQPSSAQATMSSKNKEMDIDLSLDIKGNDKVATGTLVAKVAMKAQKLNLEGSVNVAATVDGDGYLKLNDVDKIADKAVDAILKAQMDQYKTYGMTITDSEIAAQKKMALAQFDPIIKKINNRWIKFSANNSGDSASKEQKCLTDAIQKIQSDKTMRDEFAKTYVDNKFINIKEQLGAKDGNYGFVLDFDKEKGKSFGNAVQATSFFKELDECQSISPSRDSSAYDNLGGSSASNVRVELWVSQWSHQITSLSVAGTDASSGSSGDTKVTFGINLGYENNGDVSAPTDAIKFEDLQKEIENMMMSTGTADSASLLST